MLSFATEFPVGSDFNGRAFLRAVRDWLLGSPHTVLTPADFSGIGSADFFSASRGSEAIETALVGDGPYETAGTRYRTAGGEIEWESLVVLSRTPQDSWVGVQVSSHSRQLSTQLPQARKPVIVRTLLAAAGGGEDGELRAGDGAHYLAAEDAPRAARLIGGLAGCRLPVIYVSRGFDGDYQVDCNALASDLAGMAHVVVEPDRAFSMRVRLECGAQNVYGGSIGIYWPEGRGRRAFFLGPDIPDRRRLKDAIIDDVRASLLHRRPMFRCSWASIQEAAFRKVMTGVRREGSEELNGFVIEFDKELKSKDSRISDAEREIDRLGEELRRIKAAQQSGGGVHLELGDEQEFYQGEVKGILAEAVRNELGRTAENTRRGHVLKAALAKIVVPDEASRRSNVLKAVLRDYRNMTPKVRSTLKELGFSITEDGKHYKLIYNGDDRYVFSLPKSGSDVRGGLNSASEITKRIF